METRYQPEYNLLNDAYLGSRNNLQKKLVYLAELAQDEPWDYRGKGDKKILYNYLCYTYDKVKAEGKIELVDDMSAMCFNTGLLTNHGADIYAYFVKNENENAREGQDWYKTGICMVLSNVQIMKCGSSEVIRTLRTILPLRLISFMINPWSYQLIMIILLMTTLIDLLKSDLMISM